MRTIPPMKHVLQDEIGVTDMGTAVQNISCVVGTINPNPFALPYNQVKAGSYVTKIHFILHWSAKIDQAAAATDLNLFCDWHIGFDINGLQGLPEPKDVGGSHIKNQVFRQGRFGFDYTTWNSTLNANSQPGTVPQASYDFVLNIPRQYQQINDGDVIRLRWRFYNLDGSNSTLADKCFHSLIIYKEIFP